MNRFDTKAGKKTKKHAPGILLRGRPLGGLRAPNRLVRVAPADRLANCPIQAPDFRTLANRERTKSPFLQGFSNSKVNRFNTERAKKTKNQMRLFHPSVGVSEANI
jgi:hypothetical protein